MQVKSWCSQSPQRCKYFIRDNILLLLLVFLFSLLFRLSQHLIWLKHSALPTTSLINLQNFNNSCGALQLLLMKSFIHLRHRQVSSLQSILQKTEVERTESGQQTSSTNRGLWWKHFTSPRLLYTKWRFPVVCRLLYV